MEVYLLKEINFLSGGEKEFYVEVFETEGKAIEKMESDIKAHIEENSAFITDGEIGDWVIELSDEYENDYVFEIELVEVK